MHTNRAVWFLIAGLGFSLWLLPWGAAQQTPQAAQAKPGTAGAPQNAPSGGQAGVLCAPFQSFSATPYNNAVVLAWKTCGALKVRGSNLYRWPTLTGGNLQMLN